MNSDTRTSVIDLLDTYQERQRKIAVLHFELDHTAQTSKNEMLETMALGHGDGYPGYPCGPGTPARRAAPGRGPAEERQPVPLPLRQALGQDLLCRYTAPPGCSGGLPGTF